MINFKQELITRFLDLLEQDIEVSFDGEAGEWREPLVKIAGQALEGIATSDMLYHDIEHTMNVTMVGLAILHGKQLIDGDVSGPHYFEYICALLCHDIGYVRGLLQNDEDERVVIGDGNRFLIDEYGTDAVLTPYHVDRSIRFVREVFERREFAALSRSGISIDRICEYIEQTRFQYDADKSASPHDYPALTKAADFVGQLGDPEYMKKIPALYYEFQEAGMTNGKGSYSSPADMRRSYAHFYRNVVDKHLEGGIHYLNATAEGRHWVDHLYAHVFNVENHGE